MSLAGPHPASPPPADRGASTRALTERQMAKLERLADIGMAIAEDAGRMSRTLAEGEAAPGADPGLTFSRAARAVRLTIALQCRLTEAEAAQDEKRAKARAAEAARVRGRIHRRIERVAEAEREDADEAEDLSSCAWERLTETDDDDLLDRPVEELVARICRDLGLAAADFILEEAPSVGGVYPRADLWSDPGADSAPGGGAERPDRLAPRNGGLIPAGVMGGRRPAEGAGPAHAAPQDTEPPPPPPGAPILVMR